MSKKRKEAVIDPFASNNIVMEKGTSGGQNPAYLLPQMDESAGTSNFDISKYEGYVGSMQSGSLFNDKALAEGQSNWDQAGNAMVRAGAEVLGGTISGIGSLGAFFTDVLTEGGRQEADFGNVMMEAGESIMKGASDNFQIHRENPGKAFDTGDFAWWMEGIPSTASSLSMLIPARGVAGGLGMLGKMLNVGQKMGKTANFLGKVGTMAVVSRNAENMRESMSVAEQTREKVKEQLGTMDEGEFAAYLSENEIGQKFLETGKEMTVENYAKFAGGQAGMQSYKVNASNVAFDFIQTAIALKALSGLTRNKNITNLWMGEGSAKIAAAEANALGKTFGVMDRMKLGVKNGIIGSLGGASEGIEEIINTIGTNEGMRVGDIAAGTDESSKSAKDRIAKYLDDAHTWEAGFWGFAGGKLYEGGTRLFEKMINPAAKESRGTNALNEIGSRADNIGKVAKDLQDLETLKKSGGISEAEYNEVLDKIGNQSAFDMGINAASSGQVDNLLHSINDPAFKNILMKDMSAEDKAGMTDEKYTSIISNMANSVLEAEDVYQSVTNKLSTRELDAPLHNYILNKGLSTGYDILQREKENAELQQAYEQESGDSRFFNSNDVNFNDSIEIAALSELEKTYTNTLNKNRDKEGYTEFLEKRLAEIKERKDTLNTITDKVEVTEDHDKLVALKYKQLGNEFQIATNKEINENLFSKKNETKVKTEFEKKVVEIREQHKNWYNITLGEGEQQGVIPAGVTIEDLQQFGDQDLIARYNRLEKKLAEVKEQEEALQKPSTESVDIIEEVEQPAQNVNTQPTSTPVNNIQEGNIDQELSVITREQKARLQSEVKKAVDKRDTDRLMELRQMSTDLGIVENGAFIRSLDEQVVDIRSLIPVNDEDNNELQTETLEDVVQTESYVDMLDSALDAVETINPITDYTNINDVPIIDDIVETPQQIEANNLKIEIAQRQLKRELEDYKTYKGPKIEEVKKGIMSRIIEILNNSNDLALKLVNGEIQLEDTSILNAIQTTLNITQSTSFLFTGEEVAIVEPIKIVEPQTENLITDSNLENVTGFIPNLHNINGVNVKRNGSKYSATKEVATAVKQIQDTKVGDVVELKIDTANQYHKDTKEDAAIGIVKNGKIIMYINTESQIQKQLDAAQSDEERLKYSNMLATISTIRNKVWNNKDKTFETKIEKITSGTIIPGEKSNPLDVIAGSYKLAFIDPDTPTVTELKVAGEQDKYYGTRKSTQYNTDAQYTPGVEYLLLEGFNYDGSLQSRTPIRIHRNNLDQKAALEVYDLISDVVNAINAGAQLKSEQIEELKARINDITPTNKYNQEKSEVNGQIYYTIPKPYFKIHSNRIEFLFENNTKLGTIWYKDKLSGGIKFVVEEWNSKNAVFANDKEYLAAKGKVLSSVGASSTDFINSIVNSLQKRPFNLVYPKSGTDSQWAENSMKEGRFYADFGVLTDGNNKVSNFWGRPDKVVIDGLARYQTGNLVVEINANIKEKQIKIEEVKKSNLDSVLDINPKILEIGNKQEYSNYLDTIFPDTKIKDILFHGTNVEFDKFDLAFEGTNEKGGRGKGLNFTRDINDTELYGNIKIAVLINAQTKVLTDVEAKNTKDSYIDDVDEVVVYNSDQIYILGNEADLKAFKKFTNKIKVKPIKVKVDKSVKSITDAEIEEYFFRDYVMLEGLKGVRLNTESFKRYADSRLIKERLAFVSNKSEIYIDQLADQLSEQSGLKISPDDIAEFILSTTSLVEKKKQLQQQVFDLKNGTNRSDLYGDTDGIVIDDGLTMLFTNEDIKENTTPEEKQKNWERMFGKNVPFDGNLDNLIRVKGELAYAVFTTAGAKLYRNSPMGTEYHEAFHATTQEYLTEEEIQDLYFDAGEHYGANLTYKELEEKLAEDFRLYALKKDLIPQSKIKKWFSKIWNAIKNALGIVNRDTVFYNIYSGKFNYQPTARVREFIKENPLTMLSEDLDGKFTQQDIKQIVEWGTMIVAADLPTVTGLSNRDIMENPNQYNLRLRVKVRLRNASENAARNNDLETKVVIDKIAENWGDVNSGFWNLVIQNVKRKLNYNVGFDDSQPNGFDGNVQMQKDWDDRVAYSKSGKESFDFDLKRIIMLTPQLDNAEAEVLADGTLVFRNISRPNSAKLPQPLDFNLVYPMLVSNMSDANSSEEMMARLKELTEVNPSMYYLWNKISNDEILKAKWFTNFRKNYIEESHIRFADLENEGFNITMDNSNKAYTIADSWVNQIQVYSSLIDKENETYNNKSVDEIKQLQEAVSFHLQGKDIEQSINNVVELANTIGIGLDVETITKLVNNKQLQEHFNSTDLQLLNNQIFNNVNWIATKIVDSFASGKPFIFSERGRVKNIADLVSHYKPDVVENSYLNTQGKVKYSMSKPSHLSEFFSMIQEINNPYTVNKTEAKQRFVDKIKDILSDKSMDFSNWMFNDSQLTGWLNLRQGEKTLDQIGIEDLNTNALLNFTYYSSGDVKQMVSGYGASYTDLSNNDWLLHNVISFGAVAGKDKVWANYPIIIPSDSGNIWSIKAKRFAVAIQDGNIRKDTIAYRALYNIMQQEMVRMEVASNLLFERKGGEGINKYTVKPKKLNKETQDNLIIGYHYKNVAKADVIIDGEVWFKKGEPVTLEMKGGSIVPTGKVFTFATMDYNGKSLNDFKQLKLENVFSRDLFNGRTNEIVEEHILGFTKHLIESEIARHNPYREVITQSTVKGKPFLEYWSNDFDRFIAEYAINSYIFSIEQANMFNGVLSEYKNEKDTAKRAKQVSTTKQTTSTFHRGETYEAIIVKDLLLDAQDLKQMELNLRRTINDNKAVEKVLNKYKNINVADAQGYMTLDRLEATLKDYGRWNLQYDKVFKIARNPNLDLTDGDLNLLLEVMKPFIYGRDYNSKNGVLQSVQVKTALLPLIPKLIKGTDLEKVVAYMEKNNISELYFESAVKIGKMRLSDIIDNNGKLKEDFESYAIPHTFKNANWGLQLDVPSHLKDEHNKLGVQIAKLTFANLNTNGVYEINGKKYSGVELRQRFQDLVALNIAASSQELMEELKIEKNKDGQYELKDLIIISDILKSEVKARGLSNNFLKALGTKKGKFILPLSATNLRSKFMSILSSMFTSRVTNQTFPGGHVVVASPAMLTYSIEGGSTVVNTEGIEFVDKVKDRIKDGKFQLQYLDIQDGNITKVEALLPAWSTEFFKKGQRININELSEELRTMIGYRIPTEGKYSTFVFEVVGFLPESSGSTVILPHELIAQTGWDFDVDSLYMMQKSFETLVNGKKAAEYISENTNIEMKQASKYINELRKPTGLLEVPKEVRNAYEEFLETATEYRLVESGDETTNSRNNQIFDIFASILSNPVSYAELINGGNFNNLVELKNEVEQLLGLDKNTDNIYTRQGQDNFRNTFMSGRALKGMAANANSALAVLQNVGAKFRDGLTFNFKYENEIIQHNIIANNEKGDFKNINGDVITDHNAQSLAMSLDIVKEGFPYNLNTYTFNTATAMVATGVPWMEAGLFIRQPAINKIAEKVMNNESVLDDIEEREIHIVRKEYQAALYQIMYQNGDITKEQALEDKMWDKKNDKLLPFGKLKVFISKKAKERMNVQIDTEKAYSKEELADMIKMDNPITRKAASKEDRIKYYKEQLNIIELWQKYEMMGQEFSHVVNNLTADKLGAGPDLMITPDFLNGIRRQGVTDLYYSTQQPVIQDNLERFILDTIYNGDVYPVFKSYLEHGNVVAFESLSPLFLETQEGFIDLKNRITGNLKLRKSDDINKKLDKFLFKALYQRYGSNRLTQDEVKRLMGLGKKATKFDTVDFDTYQQYSAAEKLLYVKKNHSTIDGVLQPGFKNSFDILNRLTPKLEDMLIEKRKIHSIQFDKPNSSDNIDNFVIESFETLLASDNQYIRDLAEDLIQYDFFINGLTYGANSWREFIPMEKQIEMGIGTDMNNMMAQVNGIEFTDFENMFMRNNWNNINVVPIARTKYQYDDNGQRIQEFDSQVGDMDDVMDSKFFNWNGKINLQQPFAVDKSMLKLEKQGIKNSRFLLLRNNDKNTLVKRHLFNDERDNMSNEYPVVWYYPVSKLGSPYLGNEITNNSVLDFNNIDVTEDQMIQMLESNTLFQTLVGEYNAKLNNEKVC